MFQIELCLHYFHRLKNIHVQLIILFLLDVGIEVKWIVVHTEIGTLLMGRANCTTHYRIEVLSDGPHATYRATIAPGHVTSF